MFFEVAVLLILISLGAAFLFRKQPQQTSRSAPPPKEEVSACPYKNQIPSLDYEFNFNTYDCAAPGRELSVEKGEHAVTARFTGCPALITREPETVDKLTGVTAGIIKFAPPCETLLYGNVVWAQMGKPWKTARRALLKAMDSAYVARLLHSLHHRVTALVEKFVADSEKFDSVEVYEPVRVLLRELVATAVLGTRLASEKPEAVEQIIRFHLVSTRERVADHWWIHGAKAAEMNIPGADELVDVVAETSAILNEAYDRAVEQNFDPDEWEDSLLAGLAALGCDRDTAVHNAMGLLIAGVNTTAAGVAFALYELGKQPEWQEKIVNECPKEDDELPSLNDLPQLKLVLSEVMRMYPPFPTIFPRTFSDPIKVGHHNIPANSHVIVDSVGMQRREDIYENPDCFDPERWLPERSSKYPPSSLITFGSNATQCPGKPIAYALMAQFVATLLKRLRVSLPDGFEFKHVSQLELAPQEMLLNLSFRE